jgi:hypothetical protein
MYFLAKIMIYTSILFLELTGNRDVNCMVIITLHNMYEFEDGEPLYSPAGNVTFSYTTAQAADSRFGNPIERVRADLTVKSSELVHRFDIKKVELCMLHLTSPQRRNFRIFRAVSPQIPPYLHETFPVPLDPRLYHAIITALPGQTTAVVDRVRGQVCFTVVVDVQVRPHVVGIAVHPHPKKFHFLQQEFQST